MISRIGLDALAICSLSCCLFVAPVARADEMGRIEGQIVLSPAMPVSRPDESNERPMQGRVEIVDEEGRVVANVDSDAQGLFHVALPPGSYVLHLESKTPVGVGTSSNDRVEVLTGQVAKTVILYDAGIRR